MNELAGLPEEARKLAMERFRLLQPHLEQNEALISVAKAAGIPYRTAHRLVSEYRRHGLAALVRKKRTDQGQRLVVSESLKNAIEGLALQKPPPIATLLSSSSQALPRTRRTRSRNGSATPTSLPPASTTTAAPSPSTGPVCLLARRGAATGCSSLQPHE